MKKQLIAIAGVLSLGLSVSAGNWFDAGISSCSDWPTDGSNKVVEGQGTWTNTVYAHLGSPAGLTFEADNDKPLTFEAATAKTLGSETKSVEILSAIAFTPFAEAPEVPADAKAGAIVVNGYFHVLAKDGDANAWTNTGIAATANTTEIGVLLTNERKAIYTFDSEYSFAVDIVADDDEVSKANYAGCGSVSLLSATYESEPEPAVPGGEIDVPKGKSAEDFAMDITTNATLKAQYLRAPGDVETTADYRACFDAVATGDTTVSFVLNETGTNAVVTVATNTAAKALSTALAAEVGASATVEFTGDDLLVGFYYSFKQGGEVDSLGFRTKATDMNRLCDGSTISFTLTKPEGKGFYQTIVTPAPYAEPAF